MPSVSEIARHWGTSRQYAHSCVKRGCPVSSFSDADSWRIQNTQRGVGYRSKATGGEGERQNRGCGEGSPPSDPSGFPESEISELESVLQRAIAVENEAHQMVQDAKKLEKPDELMGIRINAYAKALDGRLSAQERVVKLKEKLKILVPMDEAKGIVRRCIQPLIGRLRSFAKGVAIKVNPSDDLVAEKILTEEIERIISDVRSEYEGAG